MTTDRHTNQRNTGANGSKTARYWLMLGALFALALALLWGEHESHILTYCHGSSC